jgi:EmrB/QacA subfamily drug resistance transporter
MTSTLVARAQARPSALRDPEQGPTSAVLLAIILGCYLMIVLDISIVITALPSIRRALGFSPTGLSWVQNAYTLTFGGLLLLGARAGDLLGRRRTFVAGIGLFTAASLMGGLAQSAEWLIAARAVQGVGAAIAAPSTLALLTVVFPEGQARTRAVSLYGAVAGGGASLGLVLGGMLTHWVSWRWGLFLNVPVGAVLMWLAPRYLPETERRRGRFDAAGAVTSTLGMTALVYGFVRAASEAWSDPGTIASFLASAALLVAFVLIELRAEQPITPLRLFASRQRSGAYLARVTIVGAMFGMFFFVTQFLQGVLGYNALRAGLAFLPMTVVMFAVVQLVPRIASRFGDARMLAGGVSLGLVGMLWLSTISDGTHYFPQIALPLVILGVGMGIALVPLTAAGIAGVKQSDAGAASGLVNAAHQLGGSVGLGILVTVFAAATRGAAHHPLANLSPAVEARHELAHAVAMSLRGSVVLLVLGLLVILVTSRSPAAPSRRRITGTIAARSRRRARLSDDAAIGTAAAPPQRWRQRAPAWRAGD